MLGMLTLAARAPLCDGVNVTSKVQLLRGATFAFEQASFARPKSAAFVPAIESDPSSSDAAPAAAVFATVIVCATAEDPTGWSPNATVAGVSPIAGSASDPT